MFTDSWEINKINLEYYNIDFLISIFKISYKDTGQD